MSHDLVRIQFCSFMNDKVEFVSIKRCRNFLFREFISIRDVGIFCSDALTSRKWAIEQ